MKRFCGFARGSAKTPTSIHDGIGNAHYAVITNEPQYRRVLRELLSPIQHSVQVHGLLLGLGRALGG
jgi:hypothetical protein